MTSMDKLVKALEMLKLSHQTDEKHLLQKNKMVVCEVAVEQVRRCGPEVRGTPNYNQLLSFSLETLLQLCDDDSSDVRMMADEALNSIIRANMSSMHNSMLKIQVELHKELRKNGRARSLRAALTRFAQLAHLIRPQKGKAYMLMLTPVLMSIARRPEESVQETLAVSLPTIFSHLGTFASDNQVKGLLEALLENVSSENAVVRRSGATCVVQVCIHVPKKQVFLIYALSSLLESVREEVAGSWVVLGVLNCVRGLVPHLHRGAELSSSSSSSLRGSFGARRRLAGLGRSSPPSSLHYIIQVVEMCLEWSGRQGDQNVVSTSLETLEQVLTCAPPALISALISSQGLPRSRHQSHLSLPHHSSQPHRLDRRSLSEMSLSSSSVGAGEDSLLLELEETPTLSLTTWLSQHSASANHPDTATEDGNCEVESIEMHGSELHGSERDKPLSPEPQDPPTDSFTPPSSPQTAHRVDLPHKQWEIGDLYDGESSAVEYMARYLTTRFILADPASVRVSVRCLALSCLAQVLRIQPSVFFIPLDKRPQSSTGELGEDERVCDAVLMMSDDGDPQLKGLVRLLCGHLLASSLPRPSSTLLLSTRLLDSILTLLIQGVSDESSVCVRHSLVSVSLFLKHLLTSRYDTLSLPLLELLLEARNNPYWLIKVKLLEVVSELPLTTVAYVTGGVDYQEKMVSCVVLPALSHSDSRVRKAAANTILRLVDELHYGSDHEEGDVIVALCSRSMESVFTSHPNGGKQMTAIKMRNNLSRVVYLLCQTLLNTDSKYTVYGCVESLCLLSESHPVSLYPDSWQSSVTPSTTTNSICGGGLLSLMTTLLTTSNLSVDLECHTHLLTLCGNLFFGLSQSFLRHADTVFDPTSLWPNIKDPKVCSDGRALVDHCLRLLWTVTRVMDDSPRVTGMSPLKRRPSTNQPSPPSHPHTPHSPSFLDKEKKKEEKGGGSGVGVGSQSLGSTHSILLFDLIKSAYNNYRVSLEEDCSEKLVRVVASVLWCLEQVLKCATVSSGCSLTEEILSHLRLVFVLHPTRTVQLVNQLLKCLFVRKEVREEERGCRPSSGNTAGGGVFNTILGRPLTDLATLLHSRHPPPHPSVVEKDMSGEGAADGTGGGGKGEEQGGVITLDRAALAVHIKLFEPIVIQALKEYTVTSNVYLQREVLRLLMQLVQLKVNYCLLDSEQVFFKFVLKQFDLLETAQIQKAEVLIPEIFQFLAHLSNEKNHSKPVISIPRVIQLCDGLMASGQDPLVYCIPALTPLVEHVFVSPPAGCDAKELDTQREVILAMLLKLADYPQVGRLVERVMRSVTSGGGGRRGDGSGGAQEWRRLYVQTVESLVQTVCLLHPPPLTLLLPLLHSSPSTATHLPRLLDLLFTPQGEGEEVEEWAGRVTSVLSCLCSNWREEPVLVQLDQMQLYIREEGDDPLNVNTRSKQLAPHHLVAKLLVKILKIVCCEMECRLECGAGPGSVGSRILSEHTIHFMYTLIHVLQSDKFEEVGKCVSKLLKIEAESITTSLSKVHLQEPLPLVLWCYLLALCDVGTRSVWNMIINPSVTALGNGEAGRVLDSYGDEKVRMSINSRLVSRAGVILYCQYIVDCKVDEKCQDLDWLLESHCATLVSNCYEPPVDKMLHCVYLSHRCSDILLRHLSSNALLKQGGGVRYRVLHCLEFVHPSLTGAVVRLVAASFIQLKNVSLARLALSFCARMLEYLLTLEKEEARAQLSPEHISTLTDLLTSNSILAKRGSVVLSLLKKLCLETYGASVVQDACSSPHQPLDVKLVGSTTLDGDWLASLVKHKCCSEVVESGSRLCGELLRRLTGRQIQEVLTSASFNTWILQHCFHLPLPSQSEGTELPDLYHCARELLLSKLSSLPKQAGRVEGVVLSTREVLCLAPAVTSFVASLASASHHYSIAVLEPHSHSLLYNFALLITQVLLRGEEEEAASRPSQTRRLLRCLSSVLSQPCVVGLFNYSSIRLVSDSLLSTVKRLLPLDLPLDTANTPPDTMNMEDGEFADTCLRMASLAGWLETLEPSSHLIPPTIHSALRDVIVKMSRCSKVVYYCRVPVEAWHSPLKCDSVPPPIDMNLLHDAALLRHLTNRIRLVGWRTRHEFEETWVCLLSALVPSVDHQDDLNVPQLNSLVVDAVSWLVLSTLGLDSQCYLHVPRLSPTPLRSLRRWKRLEEVNNVMLRRLESVSERFPLRLSRVDLRPNLERLHSSSQYGIGQLSVEYLQYQITNPDDRPHPPTSVVGHLYEDRERRLVESGLDVRSCVQFLVDLFSQWTLPTSGLSERVELSLVRAVTSLSDLFCERSHYTWMLSTFLHLSTVRPQFDYVVHQYLTVGVAKAAAVLPVQTEEESEKVCRVMETSLKSTFPPLRTAGVQALLYLLQLHPSHHQETVTKRKGGGEVAGDKEGDKASGDKGGEDDKGLTAPISTTDLSTRVTALALHHVNTRFLSASPPSGEEEEEELVWLISLVMWLVECRPDCGLDLVTTLKNVTHLLRHPPSHNVYHALIQGVERLVLVVKKAEVSEPLARLALERLAHSDPLVTLPALQLLLASLYSDEADQDHSSPDKTMERMETASILFDRLKKGYLIEVEVIGEVVALVLSDLFPASDILTKVIGEFLSPNHPHKPHMALILLQCFRQACEEDRLSLLQDWVVDLLHNFSSHLPTASWSLSCFFISASTNPNLMAVFPLIQSRLAQSDVEDRNMLCLAALDFYRQLSEKQRETFLSTIRETAEKQRGPFSDIIACL